MANVRSFEELQRVMRRRTDDAERGLREGTKNATTILFKASRDELRKGIYDKPIDKVKRVYGKDAGKTVKKWRRTGNLRRAEKRKIVGPHEGRVYNDAAYALARHNLGLDPSDPRVIPPAPTKKRNTDRQAPWRTRAIEDTDEERLQAYREALFDALNQ